MRIFALLTVRDEGDIISYTLQRLLDWVDAVFIYDTGSLDNTHEIIQEFASRYKGRITCRRDEVLFTDSIRGYVFELFRDKFRNGDWIYMADADEICHISPRVFLSDKCKPPESVVYMQYYNFLFTADHLKLYLSNETGLLDNAKPFFELMRHYTVGLHPEARFFRYRTSMRWLGNECMPRDAGIVAKEKIPIRHYPLRSPPQMIRRTALRKCMLQNELDPQKRMNSHWNWNWFDYIIASGDVTVEYWTPGTELRLVQSNDHLHPVTTVKQKIAQFLNRSKLIFLKDILRRRPKLTELRPSPMPGELRTRLKEQYLKSNDWRSQLPLSLVRSKE